VDKTLEEPEAVDRARKRAGSGSVQRRTGQNDAGGKAGGKEKLLTAGHGKSDLQEDSLQGQALYALGDARLGPYRSCHLSKVPGR
jgi:hypothetical protein